MEVFISYGSICLVGLLGGLAGFFLGIPAGALVGSMLAVALFNIFGQIEVPSFPAEIRLFFQLGVGILLGSKFTAETFYSLKELWRPALLGAAITISAGLVSGILISRFLGIEELTAFLATSPGGLTDMSLVALDVGAKTSVVIVMHLTRLISILIIIPAVVRFVMHLQGNSS
ncbi:MAG: AbrB family transcriptional regulator [Microcoleaceae cyanobacterium]